MLYPTELRDPYFCIRLLGFLLKYRSGYKAKFMKKTPFTPKIHNYFCLFIFVLSCCAPPLSPVEPSPGFASIRQDSEHKKVLAKYNGLYKAPALQTYLQNITSHLAQANGHKADRFRIHILNSPHVNAQALSQGDIFITRGLLALANSEAEIANVIGHEMAHIIMRKSDGGDWPGARQQTELAADELGIKLAAQADYDPYGQARFLQQLHRDRLTQERLGTKNLPQYNILSSHPAPAIRIAQAHRIAAAWQGQFFDGRDQYFQAIKGLAYGTSIPQIGKMQQDRFIYPAGRWAMNLPPGFIFTPSAMPVRGEGRDGTVIIFDMLEIAPDETLSAPHPDWLAGGRIVSQEAGEIAKRPALNLHLQTLSGQQIYMYLIHFDAQTLYRFQIFNPKAQSIEASIRHLPQHISVLPSATAMNGNQAHIHIHRVKAGQDVAYWARVNNFPETMQEPIFRLLNGLDRDMGIYPDRLIKLVRITPPRD